MAQIAPAPLVRINGQDEPLSAATIAGLLEDRAIAPDQRGVAVALNGAIVRRALWPDTSLTAGDVVEIVVAKQGG